MNCVLAAEPTVFIELKPIRGVLLVFCGIVVSLFTFVTSERDFYSHIGASCCLPVLFANDAVILG